uniref:(northern house mosquito) hypothetical protein n=1 Tax=Culex pipiens TaxID=7175 RepID=A0A8D8P7T0_CULPI
MFALCVPVQLAMGHNEAHPSEDDPRSKPQECRRPDERRNGPAELHQVQPVHHADEGHRQQLQGRFVQLESHDAGSKPGRLPGDVQIRRSIVRRIVLFAGRTERVQLAGQDVLQRGARPSVQPGQHEPDGAVRAGNAAVVDGRWLAQDANRR